MMIRDHRNGDGIAGAARAGVAVGEKVAAGHAPGLDNFNAEETASARKKGAIVSSDETEAHETNERNFAILNGADAGLSWGGNGTVQTSRERGAEAIPGSAARASGIAPSTVAGPSPTPSNFGRAAAPDSPRGSSGNHNAEAIFKNTTYGRS